jgi:hypothetical protein
MPFRDRYAFYTWIHKIVTDTGFACIRADDVHESEIDLRQNIHSTIEGAALIIADISDANPNVQYEVGYATACMKPVILIIEEEKPVPADLLGVNVIRYKDNKDGHALLERALRDRLAAHADALRLMLPINPIPTFILLDPKWPDIVQSNEGTRPATYGDYRGVLWIYTAIASVFGEGLVPELVNASLPPADPLTWDANLYFFREAFLLDRSHPAFCKCVQIRAAWRQGQASNISAT